MNRPAQGRFPVNPLQNEEFLKEARRAAKEDLEKVEILGTLIKHSGWDIYIDQLNRMIAERMPTLLTPTTDSLAGEHNKGAVYGLSLARDCVSNMIEMAQGLKGEKPAEEKDQ